MRKGHNLATIESRSGDHQQNECVPTTGSLPIICTRPKEQTQARRREFERNRRPLSINASHFK
jgi:hypothetical protein